VGERDRDDGGCGEAETGQHAVIDRIGCGGRNVNVVLTLVAAAASAIATTDASG
jgi:hypothetical protein